MTYTPNANIASRPDDVDGKERESVLLGLVQKLHQEADDYIDSAMPGAKSMKEQWESNGQQYLGNQWYSNRSSEGLVEGFRVYQHTPQTDAASINSAKRYTLNRTQNAIISNASGETADPVVVRWEPEESGNPEEYWLTKIGAVFLMTNMGTPLDPETGEPVEAETNEYGEPILIPGTSITQAQLSGGPRGFPAEPLSVEDGEFIQGMVDDGQFPDEGLLVLDDLLDAKVAQALWDNRWRDAMGDRSLMLNVFLRSIWGHQPLRFQWDDKKHGFKFENVHVLNVWIDPVHQDIEDADYLIFDYVMSADQAMASWPELEEDIKRASSQNTSLDDEWGGSFRHGSVFSSEDLQRDMVIVRTAWIRHQPVPMTVDEAVAEGLVELMGGDVDEQGFPIGDPRWVLVPKDEDIPTPRIDPESSMDAREQINAPVDLEETEPPDPDTGKASDNWPTTRGLLQVQTLPDISRVVDARRCPYLDIPFGWNINIPIPYSPYGDGDPRRLEDISMQINRLLSILSNYFARFQAPVVGMKSSVLAAMKKQGFTPHTTPGVIWPIDDAQYNQLAQQGKMALILDVPTLPSSYVDMLDRLLAEHDKLSGNVEVSQGRAPFSGASGDLVEQLRAEARGPLMFKSRFTEFMMQRIAKIGMDAIVKWMPLNQVSRIVSEYPVHILQRIMERLADKEHNVKVEISTGQAMNRGAEESRAVNMFKNSLLSKKSTLERLRVRNPDAEIKKIMAEQMPATDGTGDYDATTQEARSGNSQTQNPPIPA